MPRWKHQDLTKKQRALLDRSTVTTVSKRAWLNSFRIQDNMLENEYQDMVIACAHAFGWDWTWHDYDSKKNKPGKLDLELANSERGLLVFAELKTKKYKTSPEQKECIRILRACHQNAVVWYPRHWQKIVHFLAGDTSEIPTNE